MYTQNCPNKTCDYCLITLNEQRFCIETNIFNSGQLKSERGQLQNNTVNGAMSITNNCVINEIK